jgi:hypothetical protein
VVGARLIKHSLRVYIHDSDIAMAGYEPRGPGSGVAYLGYTPRRYFSGETASGPASVSREAEGLALWLARQQDRGDIAGLRELIVPFLAGDGREMRPGEHGDDVDDADISLRSR